MGADTPLTDDYVASLLKADAKKDGLRFSALGLHDLLPTRPRHSAPKPNTRFLKNVIRETDNHNASLRAREAEQTRARLRASRQSGRDDKEREDKRPSKRRRVDDEARTRHRSHRHDHNDERRSRRHPGDQQSERDIASKRRSRRNDVEDRRSDDDDSSRERGSKRRRRSSRSRNGTKKSDAAQQRRHRPRHHRSRTRSPKSDWEDEEGRHRDGRHSTSHHSRRSTGASSESKHIRRGRAPSRSRDGATPVPYSSPDADSDPLEAIIGPPPPSPPLPAASELRSKGRATLNSSTIDMHFSSTYDPRADIQPNPDSEDDWDQALEALRDRQRWKQQGAERLRAAGFTPDEVEKWARNGERREQDIKWAKRGEGREWDRGKVVDEDGDTEIRVEWGRLKGT